MRRSWKRVVMGCLLATATLGATATTASDAQARGLGRRPGRVVVVRSYNPYWYGYGYGLYDPFWGPSYNRTVDPIAYERERGYRDGKHEGEKDVKKSLEANARGNKDYLKSDSMAYRDAFLKGYDDGYREELADARKKASEHDAD